ncbi:MAG: hypothetical protein WD826_03495 [Actinomycetota bacterium]
MRDKRTISIALATVVSLVVVVVIVVFGRSSPTAFPSLAEEPDASVPGSVAFIREDADDRCVFVVAARGGTPNQVYCPDGGSIEHLLWTEDGELAVVGYSRTGSAVTVVDAGDGRVLDHHRAEDVEVNGQIPGRGPLSSGYGRAVPPQTSGPGTGDVYAIDDYRTVRADRATLEWDYGFEGEREAELRSVDKKRSPSVIFRARGPRDYGIAGAQWSPDGKWILAVDTEERLIVVGADGAPAPRILATEASAAAWYIPGDPTYTVAIG